MPRAAKHLKKPSASPKKPRAQRTPSDVVRLLEAIEDLSAPNLRKLADRAAVLIEQKTEGEKRSFIAEMTTRAQMLGLSITDLFSKSPHPTTKRAAAKPAAAKRPGDRRAHPPVKFKSPAGETWTGRGRTPRWLVALEAEGKKRADYAV